LSFLLTLYGMIGTAFVLALVLGFLLPKRWKTIGCVLPALAAAFAAVRLASGQSNEVTDIVFAALWAAIGAFPGAALGAWLHTRFSRSA
jgi:uncharacterized membrane protein YfcA